MVFCCKLHATESDTHKCTIKTDGSASFLPRLKRRASNFSKLRRILKKSTLISAYNPQSTEYYRSKAEILRVRKEHVDSKSIIIHPFSNFREIYEAWMAIVWFTALLYTTAISSFDIKFRDMFSTEVQKSTYKVTDYISLFLRVICLIDIILTFLTGYPVRKRRRVVMKPIKIAKHYVLSIYFVTDLVTSLPLDFMVNEYIIQRIVSALQFLRIIRLPTIYYYTTRTIEIFFGKHFILEISKNLIINYAIFHWFACVLFFVPQIRYFAYGEIVPDSWVERNDLPEFNFLDRYIICIYRATGNLFCIIFQEVQLSLWEEKLTSILTFIFGKVYIFYLTVLILHYLLRQRSLETKYFETLSQVQAYMSQKQLPITMQTRLLQFYDYKYNKKFFKDRGINSLLSEKLRGEINLNVCSKLVQNVTLLSHLPQQHLEQVIINLKPEIYLSNDIIIKAGSVGDCMYFLASGTVGVWTPSGKEVCHLQDGAYFGEISLVFKDKKRTANIVAIEVCEVYKLERKIFKNCFKTNSKLYKMLEDVANERMEVTQMFEDVHAKTFMELAHHHV